MSKKTKHSKLTAEQIAEKFGIGKQVLAPIGRISEEEASAAIRAFADRMMTTIVRAALGSDKYTVKIESEDEQN